VLGAAHAGRKSRAPFNQEKRPLAKIEYSPESERIEDPPGPGFNLCPNVDDWSATTPLRDRDDILTSKQIVTIVFDGLPRITLLSSSGFTRRMIVAEICSTLQKAEFRSDDRFLEHITVDNGLVTFRLGS
jgi:hypothetical protein